MPPSNTARPMTGAPQVVIGREASRLARLPRGMSADAAATAGLIVRRKVEGIWLYAREESDLDESAAAVLVLAEELCHQWLLGAMRMLAGKIAKDSGAITMEAVRPLLRAHVRAGRLAGLPALTAEYDPHLSLFAPTDQVEIMQLLDAGRTILEAEGSLGAEDFPDPCRPRTSRAWRYVLVSHLEWLGLGSVAAGELYAWESL